MQSRVLYQFYLAVFVCFDEGAYLTESIFHKTLKDDIFAILQFENFENLEGPSVSLLMICAKQRNHWYHFV